MLSTWGPGEPSSGKKVKMKVKDGLSRTATIIDDHPITVPVKSLLGSDGFSYKEQMSDQFPVSDGNRMDVSDMLFRDNQ